MASINTFNQAGDQNPTGIIIVWTGFLANIPLGWQLCDGSNGTPDYRDRFLREVPTAGTNPGSTGGVTEVTLNTSNMSNHLHSGSGNNHGHLVRVSDITIGLEGRMVLGADGSDVAPSFADTEQTKVIPVVASEGGNGAHNNMPTFFSVAFIQKI